MYTIEANVDDVMSFTTMVMDSMNDSEMISNNLLFDMLISEKEEYVDQIEKTNI